MINLNLAREKGLSQRTISKINSLQYDRDVYYKIMEVFEPETDEFKLALEHWRTVQSQLQILWGFEVNSGWWKEWELPHCKCAKQDNEILYPKYFVSSSNCPIHGKSSNKSLYTNGDSY